MCVDWQPKSGKQGTKGQKQILQENAQTLRFYLYCILTVNVRLMIILLVSHCELYLDRIFDQLYKLVFISIRIQLFHVVRLVGGDILITNQILYMYWVYCCVCRLSMPFQHFSSSGNHLQLSLWQVLVMTVMLCDICFNVHSTCNHHSDYWTQNSSINTWKTPCHHDIIKYMMW